MTEMTLFTNMGGAVADLQKGKPQYMQDVDLLAELSKINDEISSGISFPVLSIKGKAFTLRKDGERRTLMRADAEGETQQAINVAVVRANPNARNYFAHDYVEGEEGTDSAPDCYSNDGITPAADARSPQSDACATCPHAVWGTGKNGVGTACSVNTRLAIVAPEMLVGDNKPEPTLLRVPAASRKPFADNIVKPAKRNNVPFNAMIIRIGFDYEAAGVKLTFKPVGFLSDDAYSRIRELYEDETVRAIVGTVEEVAAAPAAPKPTAPKPTAPKPTAPKPTAKKAPEPEPDVLDLLGSAAATPEQAKDAADVVDVEAKPAKPAPKPAAKKAATPAADDDEAKNAAMLQDIDSLLGSFDD